MKIVIIKEDVMSHYLPGLIMGFREGLEAFLVVAIILRCLDKLGQQALRRYVVYGVAGGVTVSVLFGGTLTALEKWLGSAGIMTKVWESGASLVALCLVTTFIFWMIKHGRDMAGHVSATVGENLSPLGILLVALVMIAREGVEIAIFAFAGQYPVAPVFAGVAAALALTVLISLALVKVNLKVLFGVTLVYLIIQAGYLFGYGIHEGLSAMKDAGYIAKNSVLLTRAFDLSKTILDHKAGLAGLPLNVLLGWYSRPEWLQLIAQYGYTLLMMLVFIRHWSVGYGLRPQGMQS